MNKYRECLDYINWLIENTKSGGMVTPGISEVLEELKSKAEGIDNKPLFTDTGLQILEYMQSTDTKQKAKDIADGMVISSRKVSGAIRKLVTDGFVEKYGQNPVIYNLTEQGRNFDIKNYKESLNNA